MLECCVHSVFVLCDWFCWTCCFVDFLHVMLPFTSLVFLLVFGIDRAPKMPSSPSWRPNMSPQHSRASLTGTQSQASPFSFPKIDTATAGGGGGGNAVSRRKEGARFGVASRAELQDEISREFEGSDMSKFIKTIGVRIGSLEDGGTDEGGDDSGTDDGIGSKRRSARSRGRYGSKRGHSASGQSKSSRSLRPASQN